MTSDTHMLPSSDLIHTIWIHGFIAKLNLVINR